MNWRGAWEDKREEDNEIATPPGDRRVERTGLMLWLEIKKETQCLV